MLPCHNWSLLSVLFLLVNYVMISLQSSSPRTATSLSFRSKCMSQHCCIEVGQSHTRTLHLSNGLYSEHIFRAPSSLEHSTPARSFQKWRTTFHQHGHCRKKDGNGCRRCTLCISVSMGFKAIDFGLITTSCMSLLILTNEDFRISNANAIDLMVLLWLTRGSDKTALRTSWRTHFWGRPEFPFFFGEDIKLLISGSKKFASARCQIFLIVFRSTWYVSDTTDFIAPNNNFNSSSPGTTIKRRAWTMSLLYCEVRFGFLLFSWRGATVVSSSEVGMVMSYLLETEGTLLFQLQSKEWAFKLFRPDLMLYINEYVLFCSTRIAWHFGRMPE